MKLHVAYPVTGCQTVIEIDDEARLRALYDKRISYDEVDGAVLGDEYKGYQLKITGGNDKQGFPMKQGVLSTGRVRLLLKKGHSCYRQRKRGERKRKSVRGCIVSHDLSVLNMVIVKKGPNDIPGLTDTPRELRLGPKRANKIRKLFVLGKDAHLPAHMVKREIKKGYTKSAKIQRLITPQRIQRKRRERNIKKQRYESAKAESSAYEALLKKKTQENKAKRAAKLAKRRSLSRKLSEKK